MTCKKSYITNVTVSLLDGVEHNHVSPRELMESPKGIHEHVAYSSPLGREDIRPDEVAKSNQTSQEVLENPTVDGVSEPLLDDVDHDHVSPRELMQNPKGARESVTQSSHVKHVDMHEVSAEFQDHSEDFIDKDYDARHFDPPVATLENYDGSLVDANVTEISSQEGVAQHVVTSIHSSARI